MRHEIANRLVDLLVCLGIPSRTGNSVGGRSRFPCSIIFPEAVIGLCKHEPGVYHGAIARFGVRDVCFRPIKVVLDTGSETNMTRSSVAHSIDARVLKSSETAVQADGMTPMTISGEVRLNLTHGESVFFLEALVVEDLDVDILAGVTLLAQMIFQCMFLVMRLLYRMVKS